MPGILKLNSITFWATWSSLIIDHTGPIDTAKIMFYEKLPAIDQLTRKLEEAYAQRRQAAQQVLAAQVQQRVQQLEQTPGYTALEPERRGVGRADLAFVVACTLGLAAAVVNLAFSAGALASPGAGVQVAGWDAVDALASVLLFLGATCLASAAHRVPVGPLFEAIVWYLRAVIVLFAASAFAGNAGWVSSAGLRAHI